jgi:hypothetical protein
VLPRPAKTGVNGGPSRPLGAGVKPEHQFDMLSPIVGCKGSSMKIRKGSVGSFELRQHRVRDSEAAFDVWRRGRAGLTPWNCLRRLQIQRFLSHRDTFRRGDDPSAIKMVVSSDCSDGSRHSACGVIDQHSTSCI